MSLKNTNNWIFRVIKICFVCLFIVIISYKFALSQTQQTNVDSLKSKGNEILRNSFEVYTKAEKFCIKGNVSNSLLFTGQDKVQNDINTVFNLKYEKQAGFSLNWKNKTNLYGRIFKDSNKIYFVKNNENRKVLKGINTALFLMSVETKSDLFVVNLILTGGYISTTSNFTIDLVGDEKLKAEDSYIIHWKSLDEDDELNKFNFKFWIGKKSKLIYKVDDIDKTEKFTRFVKEYYEYQCSC